MRWVPAVSWSGSRPWNLPLGLSSLHELSTPTHSVLKDSASQRCVFHFLHISASSSPVSPPALVAGSHRFLWAPSVLAFLVQTMSSFSQRGQSFAKWMQSWATACRTSRVIWGGVVQAPWSVCYLQQQWCEVSVITRSKRLDLTSPYINMNISVWQKYQIN